MELIDVGRGKRWIEAFLEGQMVIARHGNGFAGRLDLLGGNDVNNLLTINLYYQDAVIQEAVGPRVLVLNLRGLSEGCHPLPVSLFYRMADQQ